MKIKSALTHYSSWQLNAGIFIFRIAFSAMMLSHGWSKFNKALAGGDIKFANVFGLGKEISLYLAVFGEFICPLLIILGFMTRWFSIPVVITMGVAAFHVHAGDPFSDRESSLMYFFGFLLLVFTGSGNYSLDRLLFKNK